MTCVFGKLINRNLDSTVLGLHTYLRGRPASSSGWAISPRPPSHVRASEKEMKCQLSHGNCSMKVMFVTVGLSIWVKTTGILSPLRLLLVGSCRSFSGIPALYPRSNHDSPTPAVPANLSLAVTQHSLVGKAAAGWKPTYRATLGQNTNCRQQELRTYFSSFPII